MSGGGGSGVLFPFDAGRDYNQPNRPSGSPFTERRHRNAIGHVPVVMAFELDNNAHWRTVRPDVYALSAPVANGIVNGPNGVVQLNLNLGAGHLRDLNRLSIELYLRNNPDATLLDLTAPILADQRTSSPTATTATTTTTTATTTAAGTTTATTTTNATTTAATTAAATATAATAATGPSRGLVRPRPPPVERGSGVNNARMIQGQGEEYWINRLSQPSDNQDALRCTALMEAVQNTQGPRGGIGRRANARTLNAANQGIDNINNAEAAGRPVSVSGSPERDIVAAANRTIADVHGLTQWTANAAATTITHLTIAYETPSIREALRDISNPLLDAMRARLGQVRTHAPSHLDVAHRLHIAQVRRLPKTAQAEANVVGSGEDVRARNLRMARAAERSNAVNTSTSGYGSSLLFDKPMRRVCAVRVLIPA